MSGRRLTLDHPRLKYFQVRGNSSVGRAQPCQGWGREFESRFPLQFVRRGRRGNRGGVSPFYCIDAMRRVWAGWQSGYAAACKAVYAGSIPTPASILNKELGEGSEVTASSCAKFVTVRTTGAI